MDFSTSNKLFAKANTLIPGGVNSPVRAFKAVGGNPVFIKSALGPHLFDEDGNRFIELINSWGPMVLGHAHPVIQNAIQQALPHSLSFGAPTRKEVEMAELIVLTMPSVEKVRMVNSGTEATMSAIRLARGYTGRSKIIKFEGCYHGHGDSFLIAAGSGAITLGVPDSPGVTAGVAADTLTAVYNDLEQVTQLVKAYPNEIAAIIIEPVAGNMGCVLPKEGFLQGLRALCDKNQMVLIFDEVMTGFRLAPGGAQELYNIRPDLTTLGKIIGGGMPVGAYGGHRALMDYVSPAGPVYQAGTLSGNPVAMSAGIAMLTYLLQHPEVYTKIENTTHKIVHGIRAVLDEMNMALTINYIGSMFTLFFTTSKVENFTEAKMADTARFGKYFNHMLQQGIYLAPSQFESLFVSAALEENHIAEIIAANRIALEAVHDFIEK